MVVEHLKEPRIGFPELNRVLAPGGTILLHTPNLRSPIGQVTVEFLPGPRPFFHYFAPLAEVELLLPGLS